MSNVENKNYGIIKDIMQRIKEVRAKNTLNYEFVTLEEFFYFACEFKEVRESLEYAGMLHDDINTFKDLIHRFLVQLKKTNDKKDFIIAENLNFVVSSVYAMSMNVNRDVSFNDVIKTVMVNKNKDESDKCINIRETLERFNVSLDKLLEARSPLFYGEYNDDREEDFSQEKEENISVSSFITDLTSDSEVKKFTKAIGRESYVHEMSQGLHKKKKSSVLLVGHPGVGKNAIVESFALSIYNEEIPAFSGYKVYQVNLSQMVGGSKYRGDFERKFNALANFVKDKECIIFIDETHMIQNAGSVSQNDLSMANLLKPFLESGEMKVIGATTYEEKRKYMDKDTSLIRRFEVINVEEMTPEECVSVIEKKIETYENHHGVKYQKGIFKKIVDLSVRYVPNKKLPDKAFDIIDTLGAIQKINGKKIVTEKDVDAVIAKIAHIPIENISSSGLEGLLELSEKLNKVIFGQEEAIDSLYNEILISKTNIGDNGKRKPLGSFMFAGPTGVGKTEVTNELGKILNMPVIRLDMSEYMEKHSVSKLIGSPPGFVGHTESSMLFKKIESNPYSIILFDEFEKAHEDVQNLLLQLLDNGFMTDPSGKDINFRNSIVIITTNAGSRFANNGSVGFVTNENQKKQENVKKELERLFKPEFRNRLDHIIYFNELSNDMSHKITVKKLESIAKDMKEHHNITMKFSEELIKEIADSVFKENNKMGARPIDRKIKEVISKKLSILLIKKNIESGETINATVKDGEMVISKKEMKNKDYISNALKTVKI